MIFFLFGLFFHLDNKVIQILISKFVLKVKMLFLFYLHDLQYLIIFFAAKARARIKCAECGKYRVVYSRCAMNQTLISKLLRMEEELVYTCGTSVTELTQDDCFYI